MEDYPKCELPVTFSSIVFNLFLFVFHLFQLLCLSHVTPFLNLLCLCLFIVLSLRLVLVWILVIWIRSGCVSLVNFIWSLLYYVEFNHPSFLYCSIISIPEVLQFTVRLLEGKCLKCDHGLIWGTGVPIINVYVVRLMEITIKQTCFAYICNCFTQMVLCIIGKEILGRREWM